MAKKSSTKKKASQISKPLHAANAAVVSEKSRTPRKAEAKATKRNSTAAKKGATKKNSAPKVKQNNAASGNDGTQANTKANNLVSAKIEVASKAKVKANTKPKVSLKTKANEKAEICSHVEANKATISDETKVPAALPVLSCEQVPCCEASASIAPSASTPEASETETLPAHEPAPVAVSSSATAPGDDQDDASALFTLGVRYSTGRDVEQDLVAAHKWLNLAATMGHQEAKTWRADIASEMTKAQIAEAQKLARAWLQDRNAKRTRESEASTPEQQQMKPVVKRPIYVRRHAQAMRSAQSFARVCACA